MFPTIISYPIPIHSYGVMIAVAFLVALYFAKRDARKMGVDPDVIADVAFWTLIVGLVGCRVLFIIMFPDEFSWRDPLGWIAIWRGGLVFQGAFPPAFLFVYFYLRKKRQDFWKVLDVSTPYMALANGIGRIGCFLNGCCYGMRTSLPWGVRFPRVPWDTASYPADNTIFAEQCKRFGLPLTDQWTYPVHPTQLYDAAFGLILCLALIYLRKRWNPFKGFLFPTYVIIYSLYRFLVEFLRDDNPAYIGSLTFQQVFCILFALAGIVLFILLQHHARRNEASAKKAR